MTKQLTHDRRPNTKFKGSITFAMYHTVILIEQSDLNVLLFNSYINNLIIG